MAQILVRDLDERAVERLKGRAKRHGRSLQAEAKGILEQAAKLDAAEARKLAGRIRARLKGRRFGESAAIIRRGRER